MKIDDLASLQQRFSGEIVLPGDAAYDEASKVFVKKGRPALVVRPQSAQDVAAAIAYARQHQLVISVRGGGHSNAGLSTNDDGLVIDLSPMNTVEAEAETHTVHIGAGAVWGQVAQALKPYGLAISSGDTTTVGVAGLTLGGGIGWMVRRLGLALDQLKEVELVTADGQVLVVSETENSDLFWGIRGAGSNFGIVTRLTFMAHPLKRVFSGAITYDPAGLHTLLVGWRDAMRNAPEELTTTFVVMPPMDQAPASVQILCCYAGDNEQAATAAIAPLLQLPGTQSHEYNAIDYADILDEAHRPDGMDIVVRSALVQDCSDELIKNLVELHRQNAMSVLMLRYIGKGALNRVPADATAFAHRNTEVAVVWGAPLMPDAQPGVRAAMLEAWSMVEPFASGVYLNFLSDATPTEVAQLYPPATYKRLAGLKRQYDPDNVFRMNFNILPE